MQEYKNSLGLLGCRQSSVYAGSSEVKGGLFGGPSHYGMFGMVGIGETVILEIGEK